MNSDKIIKSGKRKRAVARAVLVKGEGKITINKKPYQNLQMFDRLKFEEPIRIAQNILGKLNFDVSINVEGGGEKSQIEAARLALTRAIVEFSKQQNSEKILGHRKTKEEKDFSVSKELTDTFLKYDRNLIIADIRRKEAYKPGDSKARRKRQTSYR